MGSLSLDRSFQRSLLSIGVGRRAPSGSGRAGVRVEVGNQGESFRIFCGEFVATGTDRRGSRDVSPSRTKFERGNRENRRNVKPPASRKPREMGRDEKLDTFGRLRTPRAAREIALCVLYAATLRSVPALQVFEERMNQRIGRDFDREILKKYDHNPADIGDNETEEDEAKAVAAMQQQEEEADMEASVLMAPLPLVYTRFVLSLVRNTLKATSERWCQQESTIKDLFPKKWKSEPELALIPLCVMQIALTEIATTDISPKVIINEAIDLTRRFCDGQAPRIVNGCLGKYMENQEVAKRASFSALGATSSEGEEVNLQPVDAQ